MNSDTKKLAVILSSFGSADSIIRTRTIDALALNIKSAFPEIELRQAYTANFMRRKLKAQGVTVLSIEEQIATLKADGFDKIIILPSHLTPGEEFDFKIKIFAGDEVIVLPPLFTLDCNTEFDKLAFNTVIDCFIEKFSCSPHTHPRCENFFVDASDQANCENIFNEQLVLVGHGSPHRHNPVYENLQRLADEQNLKVHIGVIEVTDTPNFNDVINRLQQNRATNILLAPLLFNGGVHVNEDIAGNENSWKVRLIEQGFNVRVCTDGLGSFENFRQLYLERLKSYIKS